MKFCCLNASLNIFLLLLDTIPTASCGARISPERNFKILYQAEVEITLKNASMFSLGCSHSFYILFLIRCIPQRNRDTFPTNSVAGFLQ